LKCLGKKSKQYCIIWSEIKYSIQHYCYREWYQWEIFPTFPNKWKSAKEKNNRYRNPLNLRKQYADIVLGRR
jgi:hypothetical protein